MEIGKRNKLSLGLNDQSNDQTVETKSLRENEDQNHTDEKLGLLSSGTDTSVTNNTNSNTSSKTRETDTETSTQVSESGEASVIRRVDGRTDDDSNNQTVDTNDTSHNNGNHRLHHQIRVHHTHGGNSDTTLGGTVGSAHTGEDQSGGDSHESKEGSGGGSICAIGEHNH